MVACKRQSQPTRLCADLHAWSHRPNCEALSPYCLKAHSLDHYLDPVVREGHYIGMTETLVRADGDLLPCQCSGGQSVNEPVASLDREDIAQVQSLHSIAVDDGHRAGLVDGLVMGLWIKARLVGHLNLFCQRLCLRAGGPCFGPTRRRRIRMLGCWRVGGSSQSRMFAIAQMAAIRPRNHHITWPPVDKPTAHPNGEPLRM